MSDPKESPAVQSMKIEQAAQRERGLKGELDKGLEDSFPASDPVSATHSSVSGGRIDVDEAERVSNAPAANEEYDLVDEALRSARVGHHPSLASDPSNNEARSFARGARRTAEQTSEIASGTRSLAKAEARSLLQTVQTRVRENPIGAVAVVAALAFVFGATR